MFSFSLLLNMFAFRPFAPYLAHLDFIFADWEPVWINRGPSWAHLWAILGDPGPIFGPSRASLAQSWGRVGATLGRLRLIWKASWAIVCHLRAQLHLSRPFWTHLGHLGALLGLLEPNLGLSMSLRPCKNICYCIVF